MPKGQTKRPVSGGCKKVTNPCKICLQPVSAKDGLQCQGACEAWVHFECLNYTPGKIKDIQAGLITVTCPCPDCKTSVPKEYRNDEPFTCNNVMCPANNPPSCEVYNCQANEESRGMPARCPPPGTLRSCAYQICREYSAPTSFKSAPTDACMEGATVQTRCENNGLPVMTPQHPYAGPVPGPGGMCGPNGPGIPNMQQMQGMQGMPGMPGMPGMQGMQMPGQLGPALSPELVQQMCKTVGELAQQLNNLMASFGGAAMPGGPVGIKPCGSDGVTCGGKAGCNKCGNKPKNTVPGMLKKPGCTGGCGQAGQTGCAQPCHCPGKPTQK